MELLFKLVHKGILSHDEHCHKVTFRDIGLAYVIDLEESVDCPSLIIRHMARIIDPVPSPHHLTFAIYCPLFLRSSRSLWVLVIP